MTVYLGRVSVGDGAEAARRRWWGRRGRGRCGWRSGRSWVGGAGRLAGFGVMKAGWEVGELTSGSCGWTRLMNGAPSVLYLELEGFLDKVEVGIIGGSGLYSMPGLTGLREVAIETPFGAPSDPYMVGELDGRPVAFLARHGKGHRISRVS